jgi:hypothetical protein
MLEILCTIARYFKKTKCNQCICNALHPSPGLKIRIDPMRISLLIRIQHFYNCGSGSSSGYRVLMTKNWKKFKAEKNVYIFLIKNCNLLIPRPQ